MPTLLLAMATVAVLCGWLFSRRGGRRKELELSALTEGFRALEAGRLDHRLDAGCVTLRGVADGFNRMAEGIERRHVDLVLARRDSDEKLSELVQTRGHHRSTLEEKVKERTAEVQKAYEELKKVDALKDTFLSSVSHELRTPLSSIRSFSEILLTYEGDRDTQREFLGIINQESERLTRLIDDVLEISKIESGELRWRVEPLSLADVCAQAMAPLAILARNKKQALVVNVSRDLPLVMADHDRLIQVLANLVSNAVKFTGEGGTISVMAEIETDDAGGPGPMARIIIEDDGIGIPREEFKNVFEKFKQVGETLTGKPTGTGLGLSISREIIDHLGGTLWLESVPGRGSRFFFTVPVAGSQNAALEEAGARARPLPAPVDRPAPARRVLLAGTDPSRRRRLREGLTGDAFEVAEANGLDEAIELCRETLFALIVLDVPAPADEGLIAMRRLRGAPACALVPVLVVSEDLGREAALSAGASGHLGLPPGRASLRDAIQPLLPGLAPRKRFVGVADDDAGTVGVLSELLSLRGYAVLTAFNGDEAVRVARDNDLDLLILDLNMPRKSGWKVLEELRSEHRTKDLPVIVLSGMDAEMDRARALALGAVEFIEKGKGLARLTAEIDLLVQRSV